MNAPDVKKARSGSHVLVLIRRFLHHPPSFNDRASNVPMSWLCGSWRRSSHIATKRPFASAAIHGKNWLLGAGCPWARLIVSASDHVIPLSWERLTSMLPLARPEM